jgi:lipopolysaccharide biosynthesis glycosyltransferase
MEHNNHISNDQDAINAAAEGHKLRLHPKYDYMHVWWHANTPEYDADYAALFTQAEQNPVIVHFVGVKPIHKECRNRFTSEYQAYAALVPEYVALNNEIGIHKTGKGRPKLPWYKRLLWLETSTDKTHYYLNILGLCIRLKRA